MYATFKETLMDYRLKKIINIIHEMNEEMVVANAAGSSGGFSGNSPASGPTAGKEFPMGKMRRRKTIIGKGKYPGARERFKQGLKFVKNG